MKVIALALNAVLLLSSPAYANRGHACHRTLPCAQAVEGRDLRLCLAYVEKQGCAALTGEDHGWCGVLSEQKSCYEELRGSAQEACEEEEFPGAHLYWRDCGKQP